MLVSYKTLKELKRLYMKKIPRKIVRKFYHNNVRKSFKVHPHDFYKLIGQLWTGTENYVKFSDCLYASLTQLKDLEYKYQFEKMRTGV